MSSNIKMNVLALFSANLNFLFPVTQVSLSDRAPTCNSFIEALIKCFILYLQLLLLYFTVQLVRP